MIPKIKDKADDNLANKYNLLLNIVRLINVDPLIMLSVSAFLMIERILYLLLSFVDLEFLGYVIIYKSFFSNFIKNYRFFAFSILLADRVAISKRALKN